MVFARYRLVYAHLAVGLFVIPFGLGHFDSGDLIIRLPAVLLVAIDAGSAFQVALTYSQRIWPYRELGMVPEQLRWGFFNPGLPWAAAFGYYLICLWVVIAIVQAPDAPVGSWFITTFFIGGFFLIAIYKFALVRLSAQVADVLEDIAHVPH